MNFQCVNGVWNCPTAPVQNGQKNIPLVVAAEGYNEYSRSQGTQQSFSQLNKRGGFGAVELCILLYDKIKRIEDGAAKAKEAVNSAPNTGSPKLPPEIAEAFYAFCVSGGWNKATYDMLDTVFTFCTKRQLRAGA